MELEEAIERLNEIVEQFYEFPNPQSIILKDVDIITIETVLKGLENSINKDKIKEKIEKNNKKIYGSAFVSTRYENKLKMENVILKELLEE